MEQVRKKVFFIIICFIVAIMYSIKFINYQDGYFDIYIEGFLLFATIFVFGILYFKNNINDKSKIGIILVFLAIFVSYPLFTNYLVYSHDLDFSLTRIEALKDTLSILQFPTRIYPMLNNGYGYALPTFYPDLFLYIPAILRLLNTSLIFCQKIMLFLINLISVICMYFAVKNISKSKSAGIISAFIYSTATYRLVTVYVRSAIGEGLALAFFPLVIWGLYEICIGNKNKWYIFAIGCTCILQTHILSIITASMICVSILLCFIKQIIKQKRYKQLLLSLITIILINLWFIVPFLDGYRLNLDVKSRYLESQSYIFSKHSVIPAQLFNAFDGVDSYDLSEETSSGMENDINLSLGILCILGLIISISYWFKNKNKQTPMVKFIRLLTAMAIIFLILSTSLIPWEELENNFILIKKLSVTMQFAWRFLGPATLFITMVMSIIIGKYIDNNYDKNKTNIENYKILIYIAILSIISFTIIIQPYTQRPIDKTTNFDIKDDKIITLNREYYLEHTNTEEFLKDRYLTSSQNIIINSNSKKYNKIVLNYTNNEGTGYIEVPLLYYPGYTAKDENNNYLNITCGSNNVIRIELNEKKSGNITINYSEKGIYILADIISLISIYFFIRNLINKTYSNA